VSADSIFDGLNDEQRRAVEAVRGPVCILAGAGSGKTTTITRRVANQVATGTFAPGQILAVTFTDKAAGEMRHRLQVLGVRGVQARTFHSAALRQLSYFAPARVGRIMSSKALLLRQIGNSLPGSYRFRPAGDLATEVEWAKNERLTPSTYLQGTGEHEPPIPADLMQRVFARYERRKAEAGAIDFEDLLELAIRTFDEDENALVELRDRYRAFTVDEYQDVNLLQQTLLDRWLGERDDLCVVGDDYQSIYGFTAATPDYLVGMPRRFPAAAVVRLERNYRSSPQVLALANRLVPELGGAEKSLAATLPDGEEPAIRPFVSPADELAFVVDRVRELHAAGTALEETAVLVRTNARTADFEEAFHDARIPFQGASLLDRDGARRLLKMLAGSTSTAVHASTVRQAEALGWVRELPEDVGERELVRQQDLARLVALAREFDDGARTAAGFVEDLRARFGPTAGTGVHLLTLHRAKGLEWDAVFLPRLTKGELPIRLARTPAAVAEERRLLYVGITRARRHLAISWSGKPSSFLAELGVHASPAPRREPDDPVFAALRAWRLERARADDVPAYVVFHNSTLEEIAQRSPRNLGELAQIPGIGKAKLGRYGPDVLAALANAG
jgi:ATP-dependent DNA helicase UvrD/PcrA